MTAETSLSQIDALSGIMCDGAVSAYHLAKDHPTRVDALERIVEFSYNSLVRNRHLNQEQGEDELSVQIVEQLRVLAIQATHDTQTGGHCDVHVEGKDHFLWIGEAKVHGGYQWLEDGFQQLSTRYATGGYGQDHGEIIIYCRNRVGLDVLNTWKERLKAVQHGIEIYEDKTDTRLWFRSRHQCENSGLPFHIRHRLIPLYFAPKK
ncbi:hypothetical protein FEE96_19060 [Parasedimentitalea maritima]|uniref:Restriction endonuclease n=1 Tax=Parasedimentitalea maritima TaxID=2578117 RepID=A0ABY2UPX7_9RHOB|nr:hypothetical protein [Zongyanglinia marina]TLP57487.1 hypothetical protein FEE96_19060 [Zongyanglinia marina]